MQPAFDPEQGLPGEDPQSPFLDDAIHWITVYDELLNLKHHLLGHLEDDLRNASPEVVREGGTDKDLLVAQARIYEKRLAFWRQRANELSSG